MHDLLPNRTELSGWNSSLLVEKSELRRVLRDFENGFTAMNGRYGRMYPAEYGGKLAGFVFRGGESGMVVFEIGQ
jgi:hypothetical protein